MMKKTYPARLYSSSTKRLSQLFKINFQTRNDCDDQITNAQKMYEWAKSYLKEIEVEFCKKEEYTVEESLLSERFNNSVTIQGTQQIHSVIPISESEVLTKFFSFCEEIKKFEVLKYSQLDVKRKRRTDYGTRK